MREQKFYYCKHCGNFATMMNDSGVRMVCCGEPMALIEANSTEAVYEKHLPEVTKAGDDKIRVQVGSVIHPMAEAHFIKWIFVQTKQGGQFKFLQPGQEPVAEFAFTEDEVETVFEYCNLHGLFKTDWKK